MNVVMKKSKGSKATAPDMSKASTGTIDLPDDMWDRIARKAYDLWSERGRRDGQDLQDWLDAEQIVMGAIHEARE